MRELLERRYWERVRDSLKRRNVGVASEWQTTPAQHGFIDYYGDVPGTLPEKKIFNALAQMQISFYYGAYFGDIPMTEAIEHYRPDFILPDYHVILEIQGAFWHSQEGSYQRDYQRALLLMACGFKLYTLDEADINANVFDALNEVPEIANATVRGGQILLEARPQDPTASLRAQQQQWPHRQARLAAKSHISTLRPFHVSGARIPFPKSERVWNPIFSSKNMDPNTVNEYMIYGDQWKTYIDNLYNYFKSDAGAKLQYPVEYALALKWYGWWGRFKT